MIGASEAFNMTLASESIGISENTQRQGMNQFNGTGALNAELNNHHSR